MEYDKDKKYYKLTIFGIGAGKEGQHTTMFKPVFNLQEFENYDTDAIVFDYMSMSTGEIRHARFLIRNISGYSINELSETEVEATFNPMKCSNG